MPDVRRIAEEVQATGQPRLLRRNGHDVALMTPVEDGPDRQIVDVTPQFEEAPMDTQPGGRKRRLFVRDDALFGLIGIATDPKDQVTDVSENKSRYLAEAYAPRPE